MSDDAEDGNNAPGTRKGSGAKLLLERGHRRAEAAAMRQGTMRGSDDVLERRAGALWVELGARV